MELSIIIILTFAVVTLGICYVLVSCESARNKYKIRDLEAEVEHLKAVFNTNDKFVDKIFDGLVECTERINTMGKRIKSLKHTIETGAHYDGYRPKYCNGTTCINPFRDCVGCPRMFGRGENITTTDSTQLKKE